MLESLAMEVPVIASDLGGAAEAIIPSKTGYLVNPGDIKALADVLRACLSNPDNAKMGAQGRQRVQQLFTRKAMLRKYTELLFDVATTGRKPINLAATCRNTIRNVAMGLRIIYLRAWGHRIADSANVSFSAFLDKTNPKGISIGRYTLIAREAMILSHDYTRTLHAETSIGDYCLIGARSIVLPGISIGDHVVIGAGSVVTRDIPPNNLVAGNPARVIRQINTGVYGKILTN